MNPETGGESGKMYESDPELTPAEAHQPLYSAAPLERTTGPYHMHIPDKCKLPSSHFSLNA